MAIRRYLIWGSIIVMVAYLWTTWGNMVAVPVGDLNGTTGGAQAVGASMGKWLGVIVAGILAWVFLTATVVYNYAFARLLFVSGLERRLPHQIGRVNKNKVPANAVILQTVIATIIAGLIFFIIGRGTTDPFKSFYALYAGLTIVWCISTAILFLDIFFAKRANPVKFEEARRAPLGVLYLCGAVGSLINIVAVLLIFSGTWYPPGYKTLREWNTWMIGITLASAVVGVGIYLISEVTRKGSEAQRIEEGSAVAAPGGGGAGE
jgi:amino acid transporter